jgi:phosphatidylinositol-3,4,5-trisphosphate 3-phosphatase and dual-specificity protein phosphatase PTEN
LCADRTYDYKYFLNRVCNDYQFEDHQAPEFFLMEKCCKSIKEFLDKDSNHVALVHCKAGKGRTGI